MRLEARDPLDFRCDRCGAGAGHPCMRAKGETPGVVHPPRLKRAGRLPAASRELPSATDDSSRRRQQPVPLPKLLGQLQRAIYRDDRKQADKLERAIDQAVLGYAWSPSRAAAADLER